MVWWRADTDKLTNQHLPIEGYLKLNIGFDNKGVLKEITELSGNKHSMKFELEIWNKDNSPLNFKHCIDIPVIKFNWICKHKGGGGSSEGTGASGDSDSHGNSILSVLLNSYWVDKGTGAGMVYYKFNNDNSYERLFVDVNGSEKYSGTYQFSNNEELTIIYNSGSRTYTYAYKYDNAKKIFISTDELTNLESTNELPDNSNSVVSSNSSDSEYSSNKPCVMCNQSPTKIFITANDTEVYYCENDSTVCYFCSKKATKNYTNLMNILSFACDDCYKEVMALN